MSLVWHESLTKGVGNENPEGILTSSGASKILHRAVRFMLSGWWARLDVDYGAGRSCPSSATTLLIQAKACNHLYIRILVDSIQLSRLEGRHLVDRRSTELIACECLPNYASYNRKQVSIRRISDLTYLGLDGSLASQCKYRILGYGERCASQVVQSLEMVTCGYCGMHPLHGSSLVRSLN